MRNDFLRDAVLILIAFACLFCSVEADRQQHPISYSEAIK